MKFNRHSAYEGLHAFLGASNYHWINYDNDKLTESYYNFLAKERGTRLHALACEHIKLGIRLPEDGSTLSMYVNDAIMFGMTPEQVLFYSDNCFGTADSISFEDGLLRIHDLKTGGNPAHMEQLEVYAALFCLEYRKKPSDIKMELRIYQNDEIATFEPDVYDILPIMDHIKSFDKIINKIKGRDGV